MLIYDESNEDYHNNPAIGSGNIRDFLKSPRLFRDNMDGLFPRKTTSSLELGTLVHMYFLESARFEKEVSVVPRGIDRRTKEGKAWAEAQAGKKLISEDEWNTIDAMAARCPAKLFTMFNDGKTEVTCRRELNGLPVQCRFDLLYDDMIYDLKTTKDLDTIETSAFNYGYHIQAAWYSRLYGHEVKPTGMLFLFCETEPPYRWATVGLSMPLWQLGHKRVDYAIEEIIKRNQSGDWSDPHRNITLDAPKWAKEN